MRRLLQPGLTIYHKEMAEKELGCRAVHPILERQRKAINMNPQIQSEKHLEAEIAIEITLNEKGILTQAGFTSEEILSLLWLRQWYQTGGSDRIPVVRHLEFIKHMVANGKIER